MIAPVGQCTCWHKCAIKQVVAVQIVPVGWSASANGEITHTEAGKLLLGR